MKDHIRDLVTGIVFLVFGIVYFALTWNIRAFTGDGATPITARTMPQIWAVIAVACAIGLIVRSLGRMKKAKEAGEELEEKLSAVEWIKHNYAVVGSFVALVLYAMVLKPVGYVISTMVYLMIQIPLLTPKDKWKNKKTWIIAIVLTIIFTLVTDFMFVELFSVRLPKGFIGF